METLRENGNEHFICGDLNARHCTWDTRFDARGNAVQAVVSGVENAYVCAAVTPSY